MDNATTFRRIIMSKVPAKKTHDSKRMNQVPLYLMLLPGLAYLIVNNRPCRSNCGADDNKIFPHVFSYFLAIHFIYK